MRAVIVCGSRTWVEPAPRIARAMARLDHRTLVIHGDARGADRIAGSLAYTLGNDVLPMPANWDRDGRAAGPKRNEAMLRVLLALQMCGYEVAVHAFPVGESRGTRHMMRIAEKAGVKVFNHEHDEEGR